MKFLSLPQNGASWRDRLPYAIDLETTEASVAKVVILNTDSNESLATFNIYGVITAEFDIAPYLRSALQSTPPTSAGFMHSPLSCNVAVSVNDTLSEPRLYTSAPLDTSTPQLMSTLPESPHIALGESICFAAYAKHSVVVTLGFYGKKSRVTSYNIATQGRPVEFFYPLQSADDNLSEIHLDIAFDGRRVGRYTYKYVERSSTTLQVVWRSTNGGLESYLFPQLVRCRCKYNTTTGAEYTYTLATAHEDPDTLRRISQIIFSEEVYVITRGKWHGVRLLTREMEAGNSNIEIMITTNKSIL